MQAGGANENMNLAIPRRWSKTSGPASAEGRHVCEGKPARELGEEARGMAAVEEASGPVAANPEGLRVCRCRSTADRSGECTAKTKCRKFETNIPR